MENSFNGSLLNTPVVAPMVDTRVVAATSPLLDAISGAPLLPPCQRTTAPLFFNFDCASDKSRVPCVVVPEHSNAGNPKAKMTIGCEILHTLHLSARQSGDGKAKRRWTTEGAVEQPRPDRHACKVESKSSCNSVMKQSSYLCQHRHDILT